MSAEGPKSGWAESVVRFLAQNTPLEDDGDWCHEYSSATHMSCSALVALGQADETELGAYPRAEPTFPAILPRCDDVCVVVLGLAAQQRQFAYLPPERQTAAGIGASHGLGAAYAAPQVMSLLGELGLVAEDTWSAEAELVVWRDWPGYWPRSFESDDRFRQAVGRAVEEIPDDLRAQFDQLTTVSDEAVEKARLDSLARYKEACARHGPKARIGQPFDADSARTALVSGRASQLDWLFFRRWRLSDGWLSKREAQRCIEIFHDPLAISMRCAVVARMYPDLKEMHVR